jgi:Icc-related predicted phosphoesterase
MKFVVISDTHGQHSLLNLPKADGIIHAGDVSKSGSEDQVKNFLNWFSALDYEHKIFIAGNHEFYFERASREIIESIIPSNIHYLNDSGCTINGVKFWGSPISPWFFDWAFNRHRGAEIKAHWDLIPSDIDVLITHGPVYGILDQTFRGETVGCRDLLNKVNEIQPKFHICGHIHEAYGQATIGETHYINASLLNLNYEIVNAPVVIEV